MGLNEIYVLNSSFTEIRIIDNARSVIWTSRYSECGDFEIYVKVNKNLLNIIENGVAKYVTHRGTDIIGVIETYTITTADDDVDYLIITGRCLTSILSRRVILSNTQFKIGAFASLVADTLISTNIGQSATDERKIEGLYTSNSVPLSGIYSNDKIESADYAEQNLYDAVTNICKRFEYGIKIVLDSNKKLLVKIYTGTNKGYTNNVLFSHTNDNLASSEYSVSNVKEINYVLIKGEELSQGKFRTTEIIIGQDTHGIERREMVVNATDIKSTNSETGITIDDTTYNNMLYTRGKEAMIDNKIKYSFVGEIGTDSMYKYKIHYNLGDIVYIANNYGITDAFRITEVIESLDENGYKIIPVFSDTIRKGLVG